MKHQQHIYTPKNTGPSDVFLNGNRIERVIYADTKRGFVRVIGNPSKIDKYGKRVLWKTLHGAVEVRLKVGAALAFADGTVVSASNVENASFGLTLCAETVAVAKAMAEETAA